MVPELGAPEFRLLLIPISRRRYWLARLIQVICRKLLTVPSSFFPLVILPKFGAGGHLYSCPGREPRADRPAESGWRYSDA